MTEDDELAQIRKKKLEELMRYKQEILAPKPPAVIEVFTSPT
jgi:DNA-binding TFAR19-related protein (PDSD5 family)